MNDTINTGPLAAWRDLLIAGIKAKLPGNDKTLGALLTDQPPAAEVIADIARSIAASIPFNGDDGEKNRENFLKALPDWLMGTRAPDGPNHVRLANWVYPISDRKRPEGFLELGAAYDKIPEGLKTSSNKETTAGSPGNKRPAAATTARGNTDALEQLKGLAARSLSEQALKMSMIVAEESGDPHAFLRCARLLLKDGSGNRLTLGEMRIERDTALQLERKALPLPETLDTLVGFFNDRGVDYGTRYDALVFSARHNALYDSIREEQRTAFGHKVRGIHPRHAARELLRFLDPRQSASSVVVSPGIYALLLRLALGQMPEGTVEDTMRSWEDDSYLVTDTHLTSFETLICKKAVSLQDTDPNKPVFMELAEYITPDKREALHARVLALKDTNPFKEQKAPPATRAVPRMLAASETPRTRGW